MLAVVKRAFFDYLVPCTVFFGFDIACPSGDIVQLFQEIFIEKEYNIDLGKASPTIVDCGSCAAFSVLFFKMLYPKAKVLGFEPHPKFFTGLKRNIEKNNLSDVIVINKAVYNTEKRLVFSVNNTVASRLLDTTNDDCIYVDSVLLSRYIDGQIDLLKIDVEGAEVEVVEDLVKHDKLKLIKNILMEVHYNIKGKKIDQMLHTLKKNGFSYNIERKKNMPYLGIVRACNQSFIG